MCGGSKSKEREAKRAEEAAAKARAEAAALQAQLKKERERFEFERFRAAKSQGRGTKQKTSALFQKGQYRGGMRQGQTQADVDERVAGKAPDRPTQFMGGQVTQIWKKDPNQPWGFGDDYEEKGTWETVSGQEAYNVQNAPTRVWDSDYGRSDSSTEGTWDTEKNTFRRQNDFWSEYGYYDRKKTQKARQYTVKAETTEKFNERIGDFNKRLSAYNTRAADRGVAESQRMHKIAMQRGNAADVNKLQLLGEAEQSTSRASGNAAPVLLADGKNTSQVQRREDQVTEPGVPTSKRRSGPFAKPKPIGA